MINIRCRLLCVIKQPLNWYIPQFFSPIWPMSHSSILMWFTVMPLGVLGFFYLWKEAKPKGQWCMSRKQLNPERKRCESTLRLSVMCVRNTAVLTNQLSTVLIGEIEISKHVKVTSRGRMLAQGFLVPASPLFGRASKHHSELRWLAFLCRFS